MSFFCVAWIFSTFNFDKFEARVEKHKNTKDTFQENLKTCLSIPLYAQSSGLGGINQSLISVEQCAQPDLSVLCLLLGEGASAVVTI